MMRLGVNLCLALGAFMTLAAWGGEVVPPMPIEQVLEKYTPNLMAQPGVVGVAQSLCEGRPCIRVLVISETSGLQKKIPKELEGYPVHLEEIGEIRALPKATNN